jgi:hypothetical protein
MLSCMVLYYKNQGKQMVVIEELRNQSVELIRSVGLKASVIRFLGTLQVTYWTSENVVKVKCTTSKYYSQSINCDIDSQPSVASFLKHSVTNSTTLNGII